MQDKLSKLFNEIGVEEEMLAYFDNASIGKVVIYDKNKQLDLVINTDRVLAINIYDYILDKLGKYFKEIKDIRLFINPKERDNTIILDYYMHIMGKICLDKSKYNIFLDREVTINDNTIVIPVFNKAEYVDMVSIKDIIINKLACYGIDVNIDIDLVIDGDSELKNKIESEKEVVVSKVKEVKKEENTKPVFRSKKSKEITLIKDVIYEVENINIKGCIFGIDYFESKSGYKIITLKVTDYTDSMFVKMFTKDEEEYDLIKKLLKEGNWYIFYGRAAMDKFANEIVFNTRYKDVEVTEGPEKIEIVDNEKVKRV